MSGQKRTLGDKMRVPREIANLDIADELGKAAETDLGLPYSLICDTWDACDMSGVMVIDRITFETTLKAAIAAYNANQLEYRFNPRAAITDIED